MAQVRVVHILKDWDMRQKWDLINHRRAVSLAHGELLLAFNRNRKMIRFIDAIGGVHEWHADKGMRYDVESAKMAMRDGLFVEMVVGRSEIVRGRKLGLAA